MRIKIVVIVGLILSACGSSSDSAKDEGPVKPETAEKMKEVQDANVELEEIDGELDSLLIELK
jgi:hypothetical protein